MTSPASNQHLYKQELLDKVRNVPLLVPERTNPAPVLQFYKKTTIVDEDSATLSQYKVCSSKSLYPRQYLLEELFGILLCDPVSTIL